MALWLSCSELADLFRRKPEVDAATNYRYGYSMVPGDGDSWAPPKLTSEDHEAYSKESGTKKKKSGSFAEMLDLDKDSVKNRLVLVKKGSPNQCIVQDAAGLKATSAAPREPVKLTLRSHPGQGIVALREPQTIHIYSFLELGFGKAEDAVSVVYDGNFVILGDRVLDVSMAKFEVGNNCVVVLETTGREHTFRGGNNRDFVLNDDGSMSPKKAKHLALGHVEGQPKLVLVARDSNERCIFEHAGQFQPQGGVASSLPLRLSSHPNLALVCLRPEPTQHGPWSVIPLGFGSPESALVCSYDGEFITSESDERVFDIEMWKYQEGNVLSLIKSTEPNSQTRAVGGGRSFLINDDGSISPKYAPDLALGDACHFDHAREKDRIFIKGFLAEFTMMGCYNFGTMPLVFFLAFCGHARIAYSLIGFKFVSCAFFQHLLTRSFEKWVRSHDEKHVEKIVKVFNERDEAKKSAGFFKQMAGYVGSMADLVEFVDTDMDAMTAGNAFTILTDEQEAMFVQSWRRVPGMNYLASTLGLGGVLTLITGAAACYQLFKFAVNAQRLRDMGAHFLGFNIPDHRRHYLGWFFHFIVMGADCAGMLVMMTFGMLLRLSEWPPHLRSERGEGFICKAVAETVPSAWFQISFLILIYEDASTFALVATFMSVLSSYASSFTQLKCMLSIHWKDLKDISKRDWHFNEKRVGTVVIVGGFSVMTARLAGIFACPSHAFELLRLGCAPS